MWNVVPDPTLGAPTLVLPPCPPAGPCVSLDSCIFHSSRCSNGAFWTTTSAAGFCIAPPINGLGTSVLPYYFSDVTSSTAAASAPPSITIQRIHLPTAGDRVPLTAPPKSIQTPNAASPVSSSAPDFRLPTAGIAADASIAIESAEDSPASVAADNAAGGDTHPASRIAKDRQNAGVAKTETAVAAGLPEGAPTNIPGAMTAITSGDIAHIGATAVTNNAAAAVTDTPAAAVTDSPAAANTDTTAAAVTDTAAAAAVDIVAPWDTAGATADSAVQLITLRTMQPPCQTPHQQGHQARGLALPLCLVGKQPVLLMLWLAGCTASVARSPASARACTTSCGVDPPPGEQKCQACCAWPFITTISQMHLELCIVHANQTQMSLPGMCTQADRIWALSANSLKRLAVVHVPPSMTFQDG